MNDKSKFQLREILDLLIEFTYLATIFIIPLYFSVILPTYNVFELSKLAIFKSLVCLLLFLTLTKLTLVKKPQFCFKKYFLIPGIFIVGLGLTLFFSCNPLQSFYGSYEWQAGYLTYAFYFLWFVLLVYNIISINNRIFRKDQKDELETKINRILFTINLSGFLVALYGILQILGIDFLSWPEDPLITNRALSTFGQPNFLASWLLLVIPISAYLIYRAKGVILRFANVLVLIAELICLFFTASRGGLVALAAAILVFIVYLFIFAKIKPMQKLAACFGLLFIIIVGLVGLNFLLPGRFNSFLDLNGGSFAARINFYQAATDAIAKKPIFGYGLENGADVFISYYKPDWGIYGDVGASTDKAHNLILDISLATGLFGLILFLLLYFYFFRLANKNIFQKKMSALSLAIFLGGVGYLTSLMFSFSIVSAELYFWLFLALLVVINIGQENCLPLLERLKLKNRLSVFLKILIILVVFIGSFWGIYYEFRVLAADYYFQRIYYVLAQKQYFTVYTLSDYIDSENTNPINQQNYNRFLGEKLSLFYPEITELSSKKATEEKLRDLDNRLKADGYQNNFAKAKINLALHNYTASEKYYHAVANQAPYWPKTYIDLGDLYVKENNIKEALVNYNLALLCLPNANDPRINILHKHILDLNRKVIYSSLGDVYFNEKKYAEAGENYKLAYEADTEDYTLLKKIADTYYLRKDLNTAIFYNLRGLARNPKDYHWFLSTSSLYKEAGDNKLAIMYLDQAIKLAPDQAWLLKLKSEY